MVLEVSDAFYGLGRDYGLSPLVTNETWMVGPLHGRVKVTSAIGVAAASVSTKCSCPVAGRSFRSDRARSRHGRRRVHRRSEGRPQERHLGSGGGSDATLVVFAVTVSAASTDRHLSGFRPSPKPRDTVGSAVKRPSAGRAISDRWTIRARYRVVLDHVAVAVTPHRW